MAFNSTPKELRQGNRTPLDPEKIGDYAALARAQLEYITQNHSWRDNDPPKFFIAAGCHTVQPIPRNLSNDPDELMSLVPETAAEMNEIVQWLRSKRIRFDIKPPNRGISDEYGFSRKSDTGFLVKAGQYESEKFDERPYSRVADLIRTTLTFHDDRNGQKLSEIFRPCAMGNVVRYVNTILAPTDDGKPRRILANLRSKSGLLMEFQIRRKSADALYDDSEDAYQGRRALLAGVARASTHTSDAQVFRRLGRLSEQAISARWRKNQEASSLDDGTKLTSKFRYLSVHGFPIAENLDAWEGERFAIVPNPKSGFWETDQRFLKLIDHPDAVEIELREAAVHAEALTQTSELRQMLG